MVDDAAAIDYIEHLNEGNSFFECVAVCCCGGCLEK